METATIDEQSAVLQERSQSFQLPDCAQASDMYDAKHGKKVPYLSFGAQLALRLKPEFPNGKRDLSQSVNESVASSESKALFSEVVDKVSPKLKEVMAEMKKLGIDHDILLPESFKMLEYALKVDQWGRQQTRDYPKLQNESYQEDLDNPLNEVKVENGQVKINTLNPTINTQHLVSLLADLQMAFSKLQQESILQFEPNIRKWVERQAIFRSIMIDRQVFRPSDIQLNECIFGGELTGPKQKSLDLQIWTTPDGRKVVVKKGPSHTLQAEILENRFMTLFGLPVPDTTLQVVNGEVVLAVGFLEKYNEEQNPFVLSEKYHSNRVLQGGLILDLLLNQYNRRPHNMMMKDGKIAFIDHGAAAFCRATGGFKGFSSQVTTENLWDLLRTIPDNDPNGDVAVNEGYAQILTVEGGPDGRIVVKDPLFLATQVERLRQLTPEQVALIVDQSQYTDGPESIALIQTWLASDSIQGRLAKLEAKQKDTPDKFTGKDARDLRWTKEAAETLNKAIVAGGLRSCMIQTILGRRDSLVQVLTQSIDQAITSPESDSAASEAVPLGEVTGFSEEEKKEIEKEVSERFWSAMDLVTASNSSNNYNMLAAIEILLKSLTDPQSIPVTGYSEHTKAASIERLRQLHALRLKELDEASLMQVQRECLSRLISIEPSLNDGVVEALATVATMTEMLIWTVGDVDDQDHNLPPGLISTPKLLGSGHQVLKLNNAQIQSKIKTAANQVHGEALVEASITSDKFTIFPDIIKNAQNRGYNHVVIFDDSFSSHEKALKTLQSIPQGKRPSVTFVLVNQGRKASATPKTLGVTGTDEYIVLSSVVAGANDAILRAPEVVSKLLQKGKNPYVLMDFDGVVTDNATYRKQQEDALSSVLTNSIFQ